MTRYITRSKYTEDSSVKDISNTFKKYGITNSENHPKEMRQITDVCFDTNRLVDFIERFYDYREFLSYNSHVYVVMLCVSKHMYDLENMRINGKRLYNVSPSTIYTEIPLVVLLGNDDTIIPIPITKIYDHKDYYNYGGDGYYVCRSTSDFNIDMRSFYVIRYYNIGSTLFYSDYMFDDVNNVILDNTRKQSSGNSSYVVNIKIPPGLLDFISADRPSLEHYAIDHKIFNNYKLPKFIECIKTNINSIVSENGPPELVKIFNELRSREELISHEEFVPKYISPTQIKKEQTRKRIQELEQELNKLKNSIDD